TFLAVLHARVVARIRWRRNRLSACAAGSGVLRFGEPDWRTPMPRRMDPARLEELVSSAKDEVTRPAAEVAARLYKALLALPELKLLDGTTATVEAYYPPEVDDDAGQVHCGIDVRLASGALLEFTPTTPAGKNRSSAPSGR